MLSNGESLIAEIPLEHVIMYEGYTNNNRLGVIQQLGMECNCCHARAEHFLLIQHGSNMRFALYTELYIELTIDHIKPKSKGGADNIRNYQVLCLFCNQAKGNLDITIDQLRERIKAVVKSVVKL